MLIKPTINPEGGPGLSLTCAQEELAAADVAQLKVGVKFVIDASVPVAFIAVSLPPVGGAVYAPDLSSDGDRAFVDMLSRAGFYDIRIETWNDPDSAFWASAPIADRAEGPAIFEALLKEPVPSPEAWSTAADRWAEHFVFDTWGK